ncbi:MAG: hypothetical protein KF832_13200 [Caldilineaceae bacterium]|nr:hypothetical protein [Caldilineaceae bacterium]
MSLNIAKLWRPWLVAVSFVLLVAACGEEATPPATVTPPALLPTTVAPTATATAQGVAAALPTATPASLAASPLLTTTQGLTETVTVTAATVATPPLDCTEDADIALASYPDLEALMGCALGPAIFEPVAINEFGEGPDFTRFMLWFSQELQIYVLRPDQSWQAHPDTWTEDQPTFACNPFGGEAASPPLPRRGFGKLWCEEPALQEMMGTVAREERLCQHTVLQPFQQGRLLACYEDATIRYIRIMDDGTWAQSLVQ